MSTEIKHYNNTIKGELYLTQFFGGKKNGLSMQLTVVGDEQNQCSLRSQYVQLSKAQVQDLVRTLQDWLGEAELPFYLKTPPSERRKSNGQIAFENFCRNTNLTTTHWNWLAPYQCQNWNDMFPNVPDARQAEIAHQTALIRKKQFES